MNYVFAFFDEDKKQWYYVGKADRYYGLFTTFKNRYVVRSPQGKDDPIISKMTKETKKIYGGTSINLDVLHIFELIECLRFESSEEIKNIKKEPCIIPLFWNDTRFFFSLNQTINYILHFPVKSWNPQKPVCYRATYQI